MKNDSFNPTGNTMLEKMGYTTTSYDDTTIIEDGKIRFEVVELIDETVVYVFIGDTGVPFDLRDADDMFSLPKDFWKGGKHINDEIFRFMLNRVSRNI